MNPSFVLSLSDASMDLDAWMHVVCLAGTDLSAHQRTWNQPGLQVGTFGACTVRWTPPPPRSLLDPPRVRGDWQKARWWPQVRSGVGSVISHQVTCVCPQGEKKAFPPSETLDLCRFAWTSLVFIYLFLFFKGSRSVGRSNKAWLLGGTLDRIYWPTLHLVPIQAGGLVNSQINRWIW